MREHADLEALRSRVAALQRQTDDNGATKRSTPIPAADWAYAGRASPVSTFESVLWAASHGDVDRLAGLLDFSAEARAGAEAIFERLPPAARQQYGSADRVIATLLAGGFPKDASAMTMIADSQGEKAAALTIRVDHSEGQFHQNVYQFSRASEGWQLVVPADVMADYERILADGPPSSEISTPESVPPAWVQPGAETGSATPGHARRRVNRIALDSSAGQAITPAHRDIRHP